MTAKEAQVDPQRAPRNHADGQEIRMEETIAIVNYSVFEDGVNVVPQLVDEIGLGCRQKNITEAVALTDNRRRRTASEHYGVLCLNRMWAILKSWKFKTMTPEHAGGRVRRADHQARPHRR